MSLDKGICKRTLQLTQTTHTVPDQSRDTMFRRVNVSLLVPVLHRARSSGSAPPRVTPSTDPPSVLTLLLLRRLRPAAGTVVSPDAGPPLAPLPRRSPRFPRTRVPSHAGWARATWRADVAVLKLPRRARPRQRGLGRPDTYQTGHYPQLTDPCGNISDPPKGARVRDGGPSACRAVCARLHLHVVPGFGPARRRHCCLNDRPRRRSSTRCWIRATAGSKSRTGEIRGAVNLLNASVCCLEGLRIACRPGPLAGKFSSLNMRAAGVRRRIWFDEVHLV
jgi:hypothetical protein